jgi:hypothetical protein
MYYSAIMGFEYMQEDVQLQELSYKTIINQWLIIQLDVIRLFLLTIFK